MRSSTTTRCSGALVAALLLLTACTSDADADDVDDVDATEFDTSDVDDEFGDDEFDDDEFDVDAEVPLSDPAATVDESLTRDDVGCSAEGLGEDDTSRFTDAHYVVDGMLGAVCFGTGDPVLAQAWEALAMITPRLQLADLGLFGAFESTEDGEEVTLAFVNTLDDDGTLFQMSVNLDTYQEDSNEALLTMAHEFSHVFTALPTQLDRSAESEDNCTTYDNGEGCYLADSLMAQWIDLFWGDGLIDEIDPNADATGSAGEARCDLEPGFLGAYAASSPEEDFAESFSAYVFRLDAGTDAVQAKLDWIDDQPGLAEFRDRAVAADLGPLANNFDVCGGS